MPQRDLSDQRLTDPRAMRALAHPLRLAMLRRLRVHGPATATILAAEFSDSTPAASYHLRQLARFGFVEDAADLGSRRERWWRAVAAGDRVETEDLVSPELVTASAELAATQVRHAAGVTLRHVAEMGRGAVDREHQAVTWLSSSGLYLTLDEASAVGTAFAAVIDRYRPRIDPAARPPGSELFHVTMQVVPWDGR